MPFGGLLTTGILGAAGSIFGGISGASAAKSAAATQAAAAKAAGQEVVDATNQVNPQIGQAATKASGQVTDLAQAASTDVLGAGQQANALINPFTKTGTDAATQLDQSMGDLTKAPTMADIQIDPGFAFRLAQGQKAVANSAAAKGGAISGAAGKAMDQFSQADASQEYASAFARYKQNQNDSYSKLYGTAQMGLSAANAEAGNLIGTNEYGGTLKTNAQEWGSGLEANAANAMAGNTISAAKTQGDYLTQAGNATAAGMVGSANALNSGITGATGGMMNALAMGNILRPAGSSSSSSPQPYNPLTTTAYQTTPTMAAPPATSGNPWAPPATNPWVGV